MQKQRKSNSGNSFNFVLKFQPGYKNKFISIIFNYINGTFIIFYLFVLNILLLFYRDVYSGVNITFNLDA